ncbi:MAG: division/cell wall cluster transcriptional repressor MraZ [Myxococcota bacterium]
MFRGRYDHTIDGKGRLSIPRVFRGGLEGGGENPPMLVIQKDHIALFPAEEWASAERRLRALPEFDPDAQRLRRFFSAGSQPCPVDPQGRILVPGFMREHAGLESKVVLAGVLDRVEIWSPARFEENQAATIVNLDEIQRTVDQANRSTR